VPGEMGAVAEAGEPRVIAGFGANFPCQGTGLGRGIDARDGASAFTDAQSKPLVRPALPA
jgi:hypothetical protein